jgi:hypothetical protein
VEAKSMADGKNCEGCRQRHDCREIYGKLGVGGGPSVTLRVVIAFLTPILVFIAVLAGGEKAVGLFTNSVELRTGIGLFAAVGATFLWIFVARGIARRLSHN